MPDARTGEGDAERPRPRSAPDGKVDPGRRSGTRPDYQSRARADLPRVRAQPLGARGAARAARAIRRSADRGDRRGAAPAEPAEHGAGAPRSPWQPLRFVLTGSSARKLRRGNANLLPGRVHTYHLGPVTAGELDYRLETRQVLGTGTLPGILTDADPTSREKTLRSYAATYLKEEVQAESLTRNLEGFARFLGLVADWAGHHLDLSKLAAAAQVPRQSAIRDPRAAGARRGRRRPAPAGRPPPACTPRCAYVCSHLCGPP
jgi:hypothetical protein